MNRATARALSSLAIALGLATAVSPSLLSAASIGNRELVELTDIDSLSASPDGRTLVFRTVRADVSRNSYVMRWHALDLASGAVRDAGSGGDPVYLDPGSIQPETALWIDGGRRFVFRALVDGRLGLWAAASDGSGASALAVRDEDIEDYGLTPDGRAIIYKVGPTRDATLRAEREEYDNGILVDSSVDLAQNLFHGGSINGRMATQRYVGYWYVRAGLLWQAPRQPRRLDLATGRDEPAGPSQVPAKADPATFGRAPLPMNASGAKLAASWRASSGEVSVIGADGSKTVCSAKVCRDNRASALLWRPGTRDAVLTFIDRERRQSLYLWDTRANRLRALASANGLLSGGRRESTPCAISAVALFCVAAGPASPPRIERIDFASGRATLLFDPNAELSRRYRPRVRFMEWRTDEGELASGVIMEAAGAKAHAAPLYLNYYNCEGFLRGGEGDEWPIPALLDAGFAVACVNSVPFEGPQDDSKIYRTALGAVRPLIASLAASGDADPARVAMGGLSFGSEVAMYIAMNSRLLASLSISSLQLEPAGYWMSSMPRSDQPFYLRKVWGLGAPDETGEQWHAVSPAFNAARIDVPVLFQLPEQEARRIPELYARLDRQATPTELFAFPDEAHIKLQPRHRLAVYDRNLDWFRYWLQDFRDGDPAKAAQYRRWDLLRARWRESRANPMQKAKARASPAP